MELIERGKVKTPPAVFFHILPVLNRIFHNLHCLSTQIHCPVPISPFL